jgi:hypothetical protein
MLHIASPNCLHLRTIIHALYSELSIIRALATFVIDVLLLWRVALALQLKLGCPVLRIL